MSETKKRKIHGPEYRATIGVEAVLGARPSTKLPRNTAHTRSRLGNIKSRFWNRRVSCSRASGDRSRSTSIVSRCGWYSEIGKLKMELDWLKKSQDWLNEVLRLIARLGGFPGSNGDGEPGVKTIWLGLNEVHVAAKTLRGLRASGDVATSV